MDKIKRFQIRNLIDSSLKNNNLKIACIIIIAISIFTLPMLLHSDKLPSLEQKNSPNSWYCTYLVAYSYYASIFENHRFPLWSEFCAGGFYQITYPETYFFEPITLFLILFGVVKGLILSYYFFYIFGALSMYYLTRSVLKYNILGALYSSFVFTMCGFFSYMYSCGFRYAKATILIPLLVAFFIKALHKNKYIVWTALLLSLCFIQTALYFAIIVLFLFMIACSYSVMKKQSKFFLKKRPLIIFLSIMLLTFLFSAYYLFPLLETFKADSRMSGEVYKIDIKQANTFSSFIKNLLFPVNAGVRTMYMGYIPVLLFLSSAIIFFRSLKKWLIILFLFIMLSIGPNSFFDLHYFLWHLPIFNSMAESSKYYAPVTIFLISIIGGKIFLLFNQRRTKKTVKFLSIFLVVFVYFNLLCSNIGYFNVYNKRVPLQKSNKDFSATVEAINIHKGDEGMGSILRFILFLNGYGNLGMTELVVKTDVESFGPFIKSRYFIIPEYAFLIPSTKLITISNPNYKGEAELKNKNNIVEQIFIKANKIKIKVRIREPDRLIINQNYSRHWKTRDGKIENHVGRLSVWLDRVGDYIVEIDFVPLDFYVGLLISVISLIIAISFAILARGPRLHRKA